MKSFTLFPMALALIASAATAQEPQTEGSTGGPQIETTLRGFATTLPDVDLEPGGSFDRTEVGVEIGVTRSLAPVISQGVTLRMARNTYDFDDFDSGSDLEINQLGLSAQFLFPLSQRSVAFVSPGIRYAGESGVSLEDGLSYGGFAAAVYRVSDRLSVGPGLTMFQNLDDGLEVFPIVLIDWQITDAVTLTTRPDPGNDGRAGFNVRWAPSETFDLALDLGQQTRTFGIDDGDNSIIQDRTDVAYVNARYHPSDSLTYSFIVGVADNGQINLSDSDGDLLSRSTYDASPFARLSFALTF